MFSLCGILNCAKIQHTTKINKYDILKSPRDRACDESRKKHNETLLLLIMPRHVFQVQDRNFEVPIHALVRLKKNMS